MLQFNIANAFTDTDDSKISVAEWGLWLIGARHSQNNVWNTNFSLTTALSSWAIDLYSKTRWFNVNLRQIQKTNIRFAIFEDVEKDAQITLDDTNKRISTLTKTWNASNVITTTQYQYWYLVNSGATYAVLICEGNNTIKIVPSDSNGKLIAWTINTITMDSHCRVIAAKGAYVWVARAYNTGWGSAAGNNALAGRLYQYNGTTLTQVGAEVAISWGSYASIWDVWGILGGSYVKNNTAYCYFAAQRNYNFPPSTEAVFTIDLSNVTAFSLTLWKTNMGIIPANNIVWLTTDNKVLITDRNATALYSIDSAGTQVTTWYVPLTGWLILYRGSLEKLTDKTLNFNTFNSIKQIQFKGKNFLSYAANINTFMCVVYNYTGSNETDNAIKNIICKNAFSWVNDGVSVNLNGTNYGQDLIWNLANLNVYSLDMPTWTKKITINLNILNSLTRNLKAGFWITWGTYAAPTGANNLSWDATNGWNASSDEGSYMDLIIW